MKNLGVEGLIKRFTRLNVTSIYRILCKNERSNHSPSFLLSPLILSPLTPGAASLGAGSRQLWLAKKKLLFLTSWANENLDLLTPLTKVVEVEYGTMLVLSPFLRHNLKDS